MQLLQHLLPGKQVIAVLRNPDTPYTSLALKEVTTAAEAGQTRLEVLEARTADQVPGRFETAINAGAAGLLVLEDPLTLSICRHIAELAAQFRLPTLYGYRDCTVAGGLMSYGTDRRQLYRRAAEYVDKILERRQARRPARGAAHEIRAWAQPQGREGPWDHVLSNAPDPGGRGGPIGGRRGTRIRPPRGHPAHSLRGTHSRTTACRRSVRRPQLKVDCEPGGDFSHGR